MDKIKRIDEDKKDVEEQLRMKTQEELLEERKLSTLRTEESLLKVESIEFNNKLSTRIKICTEICGKYSLDVSLLNERIEKPFRTSDFIEKVSMGLFHHLSIKLM